MKKIVLSVNNLKKYYGKSRGIDDVSFSLSSGEVLGFIGPNGSGKSTTIKAVLDLVKPDNGNVKIFDKDITKSFTDIMQFVGYLPSEVSAYENMTAKGFLNYAASFYEIDYKENITSLANRLNLDLTKPIKEMSLGNRKKVGIINALFHEPKLIILDEPTNGLDPLVQLELIKILNELKNKGCAILFSSHILNDVQSICDRIMIIKEGKIVTIMDKKNLKQAYKKVYIDSNRPLDVKYFNLEGIKELNMEEKKADFLFAGNINELVKRLNTLDLQNLTISEPSLEELFLHFYF